MAEKRSAYVQKMKAQLDEWDAEIDRYLARARDARADADLMVEDELETLRKRREDLKTKLAEVEGASGEAAGEVRTGLESAWQELSEAFARARDKYR